MHVRSNRKTILRLQLLWPLAKVGDNFVGTAMYCIVFTIIESCNHFKKFSYSENRITSYKVRNTNPCEQSKQSYDSFTLAH